MRELTEFYHYIQIPGMPAHVTYTWVVMGVLIVLSIVFTRTLRLIPQGGQNFFEVVLSGIYNFAEGVMGHKAVRFFPLVASLALFILVSNVVGLIPGFVSPTANLNTTVALALVVFVTYQFVGFKTHGLKYGKHFTGPIPWLAWLMVPIEVIGHLARPLSLSIRLFGNIKGEDLVLLILAFLVPYIIPVPMMVLALFTSLIQAFVFVLLTMVYISGALEEPH